MNMKLVDHNKDVLLAVHSNDGDVYILNTHTNNNNNACNTVCILRNSYVHDTRDVNLIAEAMDTVGVLNTKHDKYTYSKNTYTSMCMCVTIFNNKTYLCILSAQGSCKLILLSKCMGFCVSGYDVSTSSASHHISEEGVGNSLRSRRPYSSNGNQTKAGFYIKDADVNNNSNVTEANDGAAASNYNNVSNSSSIGPAQQQRHNQHRLMNHRPKEKPKQTFNPFFHLGEDLTDAPIYQLTLLTPDETRINRKKLITFLEKNGAL
jgi:hypothetical protein